MRNVNSPAATWPGLAMGRMTSRSAVSRDAPSIIAASSISSGMARKKPTSIHTANGTE